MPLYSLEGRRPLLLARAVERHRRQAANLSRRCSLKTAARDEDRPADSCPTGPFAILETPIN